MKIYAAAMVALVAAEHLYILWIEMFAWTTRGKKTFTSLPADLFEKTKILAANQGLYNGFLATGLIWSLIIDDAKWSVNIALFFLGCVTVAAVYGSFTASRSILIKQGLPAIIATALILFT